MTAPAVPGRMGLVLDPIDRVMGLAVQYGPVRTMFGPFPIDRPGTAAVVALSLALSVIEAGRRGH